MSTARLILVVLIAIPLIFISYNLVLDQIDKQRFYSNRDKILELREVFKKAYPQLGKQGLTTYCSYPRAKYEHLPPSCTTSLLQTVALESRNDIEPKVDIFYRSLEQGHLFQSRPKEYISKEYPAVDTDLKLDTVDKDYEKRYGSKLYRDEANDIDCYLNATLIRLPRQGEGLDITFSCSKKARGAWYQVR